MPRRSRRGHFQWCVELPLAAEPTGLAGFRTLEDCAQRLLTMFNRHLIPATWAISNGPSPRWTRSLQCGVVQHELAVLGEPTWMSPNHSRQSTAIHLESFLAESKRQGMSISSFVSSYSL